MPPNERSGQPSRTAREVIDQAIHENRLWEYVCLALILAFATTGITIVVYGAVVNNWALSISGSAVSILVWPSLSRANRIWDENRRIRLLEIALSQAKSGTEAIRFIREIFRAKDSGAKHD